MYATRQAACRMLADLNNTWIDLHAYPRQRIHSGRLDLGVRDSRTSRNTSTSGTLLDLTLTAASHFPLPTSSAFVITEHSRNRQRKLPAQLHRRNKSLLLPSHSVQRELRPGVILSVTKTRSRVRVNHLPALQGGGSGLLRFAVAD